MTTASPFPGERPSRCLKFPKPLLPSLLSSRMPRALSFHVGAQRSALSLGSGGNAIGSRPAGQGRVLRGISTIPRPACWRRLASRPSSFRSTPMTQRKTRVQSRCPSAESSRRRRSRRPRQRQPASWLVSTSSLIFQAELSEKARADFSGGLRSDASSGRNREPAERLVPLAQRLRVSRTPRCR